MTSLITNFYAGTFSTRFLAAVAAGLEVKGSEIHAQQCILHRSSGHLNPFLVILKVLNTS